MSRSTHARVHAELRRVAAGVVPTDARAEKLLEGVARLPGMMRITALPDTVAAKLEAPVSVVTEVRDLIIPALGSNSINCGVGLIDTGLDASDLDSDDLGRILQRIWTAAESHEYDISAANVDRFLLQGVPALADRGWLGDGALDAFEFGGDVVGPAAAARIDLDDLMPWTVRNLTEIRRPARLQLRGNHFLELQVVDDVVDPARLKAWGLAPGRLVLMLHMDHRITGAVNLHFVTRKRYPQNGLRRRTFFASKLQFHFGAPADWRHGRERLRYYYMRRGLAGIPVDSCEGRRYLMARAVCTNYGYAGRALIYRMCMDALSAFGGADAAPRILRDTNHESFRVQRDQHGAVVIGRTGAVQSFPGTPALVLGSFDSSSLLGECLGSDLTAYSYDHGSKHVRRVFREDRSRIEPDKPAVARYYVSPAAGARFPLKTETSPIRSKAPLERLAMALHESRAVRPIAWLRPAANLGFPRPAP